MRTFGNITRSGARHVAIKFRRVLHVNGRSFERRGRNYGERAACARAVRQAAAAYCRCSSCSPRCCLRALGRQLPRQWLIERLTAAQLASLAAEAAPGGQLSRPCCGTNCCARQGARRCLAAEARRLVLPRADPRDGRCRADIDACLRRSATPPGLRLIADALVVFVAPRRIASSASSANPASMTASSSKW